MQIIDTLGWRMTGLRNRLSDRLWERRLGINTSGIKAVDAPDANIYSTAAYRFNDAIVGFLDLKTDDVFVDIGCGKGRVICCAALRKAKKVIGIDIDPELCRIARDNAERMRGRKSPIEILNKGGQEFDYGDCTVMTLFNSFGAATVREMLAAIEESLRVNPRPIRFAYVNPFHETLFKESRFLEKYGSWQRRPWSGLKFDVSFWRSPGSGG